MKTTQIVAVVYEDPIAREEAVGFCDHLVEQFWNQFSFDIGWCSFTSLLEADSIAQATRKAADADWIIFAARPEGEMPFYVRAWIETWLKERGEREGVLVSLGAGTGPASETADKPLYLRQVAHRAGMDYLTQFPSSLSHPIPDSPESCTARAAEVTSVLEGILHHPPPGRLASLESQSAGLPD